MGRSFVGLVVTVAVVVFVPQGADAQVCCAGTAAVSIGRLTLHEEALIGMEMRASQTLGVFGKGAAYLEGGAREVEIEQSLFATARFVERAQATVRLPFVQTFMDTGRQRDAGGGVGDVQLAGRYDFTFAGQSLRLPGLAVLGSVVLPTGTAVEDATSPLGTDATGTGAYRMSGGASVEQAFGRYFGSLIGLVGYRAPRTVWGRQVSDSVEFVTAASAGFQLDNEMAFALSTSFTTEPGAPRRMFRWGVSAAIPLNDRWRTQGGILGDVPLDGFGLNQTAALGLHVSLMRSWL